MNRNPEVVIIGAGHNGLTAAAYLANAGKNVLVLERRSLLGGVGATEEVWPGFKFSPVEQQSHRIPGRIRTELNLPRHGIRSIPMDPAVFIPTTDRRGLLIHRDLARSVKEVERFSHRDAQSLEPFHHMIQGLIRIIRRVNDTPAPRIPRPDWTDLLGLLRVSREYRRLGEAEMWNALRLFPMRVTDLLDEWFESNLLKAAIAANAVLHESVGPRSAGTTFLLLRQRLGNGDGAFACGEMLAGGLGSLASALASSATRAGAEIHADTAVATINTSRGRAVGVTLRDGSEIDAKIVVSNADPKRTLLELVDPLDLDPDFAQMVKAIQSRGLVSKVNFALGELPDFRCRASSQISEHHRSNIILAAHPDDVEKAYDHSKYGEISARPILELTIPSALDPTLAPPGRHVMTVHVQFTPYRLREGSWVERRDELGDLVEDILSDYITNLKQIILHRQVLTPLDLEQTYSLPEGHISHAESNLNQAFYMRPVEGWGRHTTPIENLYLCSSGTHPGGSISCESGRMAALRVLQEHPHPSR